MQTVMHEWRALSRADIWRLFPLFDIHLGHRGCDERLLKATVKRIDEDDHARWIGGGDYCEFINRSDKRYDEAMVAKWLLGARDLAGRQLDKLVALLKPIAPKCLGLVMGNKEERILRKYERDIYGALVTEMKQAGGMEPTQRLGLGWYGWIVLKYYRSPAPQRKRACVMKIVTHHGFSTGRLAGANALNLERWLWQHNCALGLMGHSHRRLPSDVDHKDVSASGKPLYLKSKGAFCGSFLGKYIDDVEGAAPYYERAGFFGKAPGGIEIVLRPGAASQDDRVKIIS
jgi:hypothetical protein